MVTERVAKHSREKVRITINSHRSSYLDSLFLTLAARLLLHGTKLPSFLNLQAIQLLPRGGIIVQCQRLFVIFSGFKAIFLGSKIIAHAVVCVGTLRVIFNIQAKKAKGALR